MDLIMQNVMCKKSLMECSDASNLHFCLHLSNHVLHPKYLLVLFGQELFRVFGRQVFYGLGAPAFRRGYAGQLAAGVADTSWTQ